jgi:hypothetical protein
MAPCVIVAGMFDDGPLPTTMLGWERKSFRDFSRKMDEECKKAIADLLARYAPGSTPADTPSSRTA